MIGLEVIIPSLISFISAVVVAYFASQLQGEKVRKKELEEEIQKLKTSMVVLQETTVTEVSLMNHISNRFRESDAINREESRRLEAKIDALAAMITQIAQHLPKRGED